MDCRICDNFVYSNEPGFRRNLCPECGPAVRQARRYGLRLERVNAILRVQNDYCPLCDEGPGDSAAEGPIWWQIDHDHECCTGCPTCVRGLLCLGCNTMLGHYEARIRRRPGYWVIPKADEYLAAPPAKRAQARKLHPDDFGWARVRYTSLSGRPLTWEG
ncbi:endonuclease domain-containing protein [Streptomyces sp. NPDC058701]|uniref:endonuclease domain-containing protein n=1 Tax=Streptomyces sp. NPDC058701 TaxID=3346608 RepID=UPI00365B2AAC